MANPVIINGDTSTPAARAGGLGFYWKQITGNNSAGPLWSNDSIASGGVTISGNTWTPKSSVTPVHDDDGNLTYDGRWESVWDAENRLTCMTTTEAAATAGVPRQRLDFVYDCQNRRVSKTVSTSTDGTTWTVSSNLRFLYDGWNLIAEYSAPSAESTTLTLQAAHVWGIDLSGTLQGAGGVGGLLCSTLVNDNTTTHNYYPAYDGNGSISAWLDSTGTLLARMDYSPFGQLVAQYKYTSTANATLSRLPFGFSTKYTDKETGLLYYGYRYYDPVTGRWWSKDPIGESGGLNLYGFVGNDGVDMLDKLGLWTEIRRQGKEWATTCAEPGDLWGTLADKVHLERSEVPLWVKNFDSDSIPKPGKTYRVPNVAAYYSTLNRFNYKLVELLAYYLLKADMEADRAKGYKTLDRLGANDTKTFRELWNTEGIYTMQFGGHGYLTHGKWVGYMSGSNSGTTPETVKPPYKLSRIIAIHCGGSNAGWQRHLSHNGGIFQGPDDPTGEGTRFATFDDEYLIQYYYGNIIISMYPLK